MSDFGEGDRPKETTAEKFSKWALKNAHRYLNECDHWQQKPERGLIVGMSKKWESIFRNYFLPNKDDFSILARATIKLNDKKEFTLRVINKYGDLPGIESTIKFTDGYEPAWVAFQFGGLNINLNYDNEGNLKDLEGFGQVKGDSDDSWGGWNIKSYNVHPEDHSGDFRIGGADYVDLKDGKLVFTERANDGEHIRIMVSGDVEGERKLLEKALVPIHIDEAKILARLNIPDELLEDPYNAHPDLDNNWVHANLRKVWGVKNEPIK